jgi:murein L,D-transpeptidase YafK
VVDTGEHILWLCEGEKAVRQYPVALGRGGVGKRRELDGKTPLGEYPIGAPIRSEQFGLFVPLGYPTVQQRREGRTGGAIGVHGPDRRFKPLGLVTTWIDWTQGCIAVSSDQAIHDIAQWVRAKKAGKILIR